MNQLSTILSSTEMSKKQVVALAEHEAAQIMEGGTVNALQFSLNLKKAQDYLETVQKGVKGQLLSDAQKYTEKTIKAHGAQFQVKEGPSRWDYRNCGDPVYEALVQKEKDAADARKEREKFLQSLKGQHTFIDEESGEAITVSPPGRTSDTVVAISY